MSDSQPMQVLVVDDDEVARVTLSSCAKLAGYDPLEAASAEEAYRLTKTASEPICILLDWMMPGMDGGSLCELIRNTDLLFNHHIIIVTALDDEDADNLAREFGADDLIRKPIDLGVVSARLKVAERQVEKFRELRDRIRHLTGGGMLDDALQIPNRTGLGYMLEKELRRYIDLREVIPDFNAVAAMFIVTDYDAICSRLGTDGGTELMAEIIARIERSLRPYDLVARLQDNTLFLLKAALHVSNTLVDAIAIDLTAEPYLIRNSELQPHISWSSINVESLKVDANTLIDQLLNLAQNPARTS